MIRNRVLTFTALALGAAGPAVAAEQEAPAAPQLQEVIVTAQKRQQNLQNVGVTVTALTSRDLSNLGVTNTFQVGSYVPGVQLISESGGNTSAQLTVRGVSQTDYSPFQESPNAAYIDDVYVSSPEALGAQMYDMERVEVLRGPQGTLFGRNSTGGLVNFITTEPGMQPDGYLEVTGGEFDEARVEGALGGPITDHIQGRLSAAFQSNNGIFENHYPGQNDLNGTHFVGVHGQIAFEPTDHLDVLASAMINRDDDHEGFYDHVASYPESSDFGRDTPLPGTLNYWGTCPGCDALGAPTSTPSRGHVGGDVPYAGGLSRQFMLDFVRVKWDLGGGITATSLSSYQNVIWHYTEDCAGSAPQFTCADPGDQWLKQWSQELRLAGGGPRLNWVAGLYGLDITQFVRDGYSQPYFENSTFAYDSFDNIHQHVTDGAVFGQVSYAFLPHWRAVLGARETRDRKSFSSQTYLNQAGDCILAAQGLTSCDTGYQTFVPPLLIYDFSPPTVGGLATQTHTDWSGKAEIDYLFSANTMLYGSFSRGVQGGGFNDNSAGATTIQETPFRGVHMNAYEIGEKSMLLGDRVRVNGAIYDYVYHDFQAFQLVGITTFVRNNDANFKGADLEIDARPVSGLDLHAAGSYLSAVIYGVHTANLGIVDQHASDAPSWSGNAYIRYSWPVGRATAYAQWAVDYVGGRFHSVDNTPAVYVHSSIGHNVRAGVTIGNWDMSVWANNVFDAARQTAAFDLTSTAGYAIHTYMPPRWVGATVRYQFH